MLSIISAPEKKGAKRAPFFPDLCRRNFFLLKRDFLLPFRMPRGEGIEMAEGVEDGTKLPPPRSSKKEGGAFKKSRGDFSLFLLSSVGGAFLYMCARSRGSPKSKKDAERRGKGGKKFVSSSGREVKEWAGKRASIAGEKKSFSGRFFFAGSL